MIAIVGLGNPDIIYENTYHNTGFRALDKFAQKYNLKFTKNKYNARIASGIVNGEKVILLKPLTYMNLSGNSVSEMARQLKLPHSNIVVIYDDIDLSVGAVRYRVAGSAGTHNGMRDIVSKLGDENFPRIRIGIGRPDHNINLADYVLSKVNDNNNAILDKAFDNVTKLLEEFIKHGGKLESKSL